MTKLPYRLTLLTITILLAGSLATAQSWNPTGLFSGSFIAVKQCTASTGTMYLASTGPNVYRTLDGGITWTDISAQFGGNNVYCFFTFNPTFFTVATLAGTSNGLYRTDNDGLTWAPVAAIPAGTICYDIATPGAGYIMVGTNNGIWSTGSYGYVWDHLTTPSQTTAVYSFAFWMMYGISHQYCGTSDGIWRSEGPYGTSWFPENNALTAGKLVKQIRSTGSITVAAIWQPGASPSGLGLVVSPNSSAWVTADTGLSNLNVNGLAGGQFAGNLLAATDNGVYETTDNALTWHDYSTNLPSRVVKCIIPGAFCGPQGGGIYKYGAPILPPTLVSPAAAATNVSVPTTVSWTYPVGLPTNYDLQYSTSPTFAANVVTVPAIPGTSTPLSTLNPATTYYWHVRAFINAGYTGYSTTFSFTTANFPAPPTVPTSLVLTPASPLTADNLTAVASGSIDYNPGDVVSYQYEWRVSNNNGASYGAWGNPASILDQSLTSRGQKWQCHARATDGTLSSAWFQSPTTLTIGNSAPSAPTAIAFSPVSPSVSDNIVPTASGAVDPDGDPLTYLYEWAVSLDGGVTYSGWLSSTATLYAASIQTGDLWKCHAKATDGVLSSAWYESPTVLTIGANAAAPSAPTSLVLAPPTPATLDDLTATASGSIDPGSNPITYAYEWSVSTDNGVTWSGFGNPGQILPNSLTTRGQQWKARARAQSIGGASAWYVSPTALTIANTPPTTPTAASISPASPFTNDILTASASGSADVDNDPLTYQYEWRVNTGTGWSAWGNAGSTIAAALTTRGQQWMMHARASDGIGVSGWFESAAVTIANSAPTSPTVPVIAPSAPAIATDLNITAGGSTDADGDPITYAVEWWYSTDGGLTFSKTTSPTNNSGQTLLGLATVKGQQWKARVQASDGITTSAWVESTPVTIVDTPPTVPTAVSISPTSPAAMDDLTATASGSIDVNNDPITYDYEWASSSDGLVWSAWGNAGALLSNTLTSPNQYWKAHARATAAGASSAWLESAPVFLPKLLQVTSPVDGATAVVRTTPITLSFTWGVNLASTQAHFTLTPAAGGAAVPGTFTWLTTNRKVQFTPTAPLAANTAYVVQLASGIVRQDTKVIDWSEQFGFTTNSAPVITAFTPSGTGALRTSKITVTFDQPMHKPSTQTAFVISPTVAGKFTWPTTSQMVFTPSVSLAANTAYKVTEGLAARSATGIQMGVARAFNFTTGALAPGLTLAAAASSGNAVSSIIVELSSAATVDVQIMNLAGRTIAQVPAQALPAGPSTLSWNGRNSSGTITPPGTYLAIVTARGDDGQLCQSLVTLVK